MKRTTFKILFLVRASRISKNGEVPIILRVTVDGKRVETTVNLKVNLETWSAEACRSLGTTAKDDELNLRLDTIRLRIMHIYRQMELDKSTITAQAIVDEYLGRNEKPITTLLDLYTEHNEQCRKLIGRGMSEATVERYDTCLRLIKEFMLFKYNIKDIAMQEVNHKFIKDLEFFYRTERNCSHNTSTKYLKNFKKITRIALANEVITRDPFANIKFRLDEVERDFLEEEELTRIATKRFVIERLAQVRDIFVFCCYTGLAFSDVKQLRKEHIATDNNGALWIRKRRQKTKNMCNIPLLDSAIEILERYENSDQCPNGELLPVLSNQKMNAYLKEIADLCGTTKCISTHTARHTAATTTFLANGVSIENVAKMLGHSDTKMTRHYAKVLDHSIMKDMQVVNQHIRKKVI